MYQLKLIFLAGMLGLWTSGSAAAQQVIAQYSTMLGPNDFYNSSGTRLANLGQVLQQDRANFHRFGLRDQHDGHDPIFANRNARAAIESLYRSGPGAAGYIVDGILNGRPHFVHVRVIGQGGVAHYIEVFEGAG